MDIVTDGAVLATVCHDGIRQIDLIVTLRAEVAAARELLSAALQLTHDQYKQIVARDATIGRLRDELRKAHASGRRAA